MTIFRFNLAIAALLASCSEENTARRLTCDDVPGWIQNGPAANSTEQYDLLQKCVHKWGARFALSSGSNAELAQAALYRCRQLLFDYNTLRIRERGSISESELKATTEELNQMALMRVVQQRAGECPLPDVKK